MKSITTILLLILLCRLDVCAQEKADERETRRETIEKNLADLKSADVEKRKRAILVLGKYMEADAKAALVSSLADPSPIIRRSALVALTDRFLLPAEAELALLLIGDSDPSIRRIASSALSRLFRMQRSSINGVPGTSKELTAVLQRACRDKDAIVRKNIVSSWTMTGRLMVQEDVLKLMADPDRDVRILALVNGRTALPPGVYSKAVLKMTGDPDRLIRLRIAQILSRGIVLGGMTALQEMSKDKDFQVSSQALLGLMGRGSWPELRKRLDDGRMKGTMAKEIIGSLRRLPDGKRELQRLMIHRNAGYRVAAVETYVMSFWQARDPSLALKLLEDTSPSVRKLAGSLLLRSNAIPDDAVKKLAESKHSDVRMVALRVSSRLPRKVGQELVMDLFLDDNVEIRSSALMLMALRRLDGWLETLKDSLGDDEKRIRQDAVIVLLDSRVPQAASILDAYLKTGEDAELKKFISRQLELRRSGIPRAVPYQIR